jgi:hypothetical protein
VGGAALDKFEKVTHSVPLNSLSDVFSFEELEEFLARVALPLPDAAYSVEPKIDGLSVALRYENAMALKLAFNADASLTLKVTVNGRTTVYTSDAWETDASGSSVVYFRGILATEYAAAVSAALYDGDVQVGQSVTYSVNSYVYSMQNSADAALAALVQATYNYGASAENYAGK